MDETLIREQEAQLKKTGRYGKCNQVSCKDQFIAQYYEKRYTNLGF